MAGLSRLALALAVAVLWVATGIQLAWGQGNQSSTTPVATFHDPAGVVGDNFGYSVSLSADGSTALIGAFATQAHGIYLGKAYIYTKASDAWSDVPATVFNNPNTTLDDGRFGTLVVLSADGNVALVTAPYLNLVGGTNYSRVYIYRRTNGVWSSTPVAVFLDPRSDDVDGFGDCAALSADGTTALISAPDTPVNGNDNSGKAYIYTQINGAWSRSPSATFADPAGAEFDRFGFGCALSGNGAISLVGAPQLLGLGHAYLYSETNGVWSTTPEVVFGDPAMDKSDQFGATVALSGSGSTALIGGIYPQGSGIVYVFNAMGNVWSTVPKAEFSDPEMKVGDRFGGNLGGGDAGLALSGDGATTLIGANNSPNADGSIAVGKAYIFTQSSGLWAISPNATFIDPEATQSVYLDEFGSSVALSSNGTEALVGTPQQPGLSPPPPNDVPTHAGPGVVYVYENPNGWGRANLPPSNPPPPTNPPSPKSPPSSGGGSGLGWLSLALFLGVFLLRGRMAVARAGSADRGLSAYAQAPLNAKLLQVYAGWCVDRRVRSGRRSSR